jgi:hypothetical protein
MIEIKIVFPTMAEAASFLAAHTGAVSAQGGGGGIGGTGGVKPETVKAKADPKSAPKTEAAAPTPPSAAPADAPAAPKIEYAPLGEKITALVAAGKAGELKALFATLKPIDGVEAVKKGSQVHADDLGKLSAGLDAIEAASDAMS